MPRDFLEAGQLRRGRGGHADNTWPPAPPTWGEAKCGLTLGEILLRAGRRTRPRRYSAACGSSCRQAPRASAPRNSWPPSRRPARSRPTSSSSGRATLYQLGRYALAIPELTPFAVAGSPRESQARLMLGISAFNVRQYSQAAQWLEPLKDSARPDPTEALFWLGRSAGRAGDAENSPQYLTLVADAKSQSRRSEEALYLLAQMRPTMRTSPRVARTSARLLRDYPKGVWTDVALWLQGWLAYKRKEFSGGRRVVGAPRGRGAGVPLADPRALLARSRARGHQAQHPRPSKAYRTLVDTSADQYYYRLRATDRLTSLTKKAPPRLRRRRPNRSRRAAPRGSTPRRREACAASASSTTRSRSGSSRCGATRKSGPAWPRRAVCFSTWGATTRPCGWGTGSCGRCSSRKAGKAPIPGFWQCTYPLGHIDLVRAARRQRALDPYLVLALIREESGFAPHAVSRTGARGLMQLMPQTADLTAREHKLPPVAPGGPRDAGGQHPARRVPSGRPAPGLRRQSQPDAGGVQCGQASGAALACSATGSPTRSSSSRTSPITETRNYVKRVLGNYDRYKSLYGARRERREPSAASRASRRRAATAALASSINIDDGRCGQ